MLAPDLAQALLLGGIGCIGEGLVNSFEQLKILIPAEIIFERQHEQPAARNFHFACQGLHLLKQGLLQRNRGLDVGHMVIPF